MPRFSLTDRGLVETIGTRRVLYGHWAGLFGCWMVPGHTKPVEEIVPDWFPFAAALDSDNWVADLDEFTLHEWLEDSCYSESRWSPNRKGKDDDAECSAEDLADLFTYVGSFPLTTLKLCALEGRWAWAVLDAIKLYPPFESFVATECENGHRVFIQCVLIMSGYRGKSRPERRSIAQQIVECSRQSLIERFSPHEGSRRAVNALQKLSDDVQLEQRHIDNLFGCLRDRAKSRVISHARRLHPEGAMALKTLPAYLALPNLAFLLESEQGVNFLDRLSGDAPMMVSARGKGEAWLQSAVASLRPSDDIPEKLERWRQVALRDAQFGQCPIKASGGLSPICAAAELRAEGLMMRHCAGSPEFIERVLGGDAFFYAWLGEERATVCLRRHEDKWTIWQIQGYENRQPSASTIAGIRAALGPDLFTPDEFPRRHSQHRIA